MSEKKRTDYLSWDEYFMGLALLSGMRSKDPNTQVGACIVNEENRIVGIGYNGLPKGCSDDDFPWGKSGDFLDTKYAYTCHAELNAILNSLGNTLKGSRIYTTLFPCNECTKAIIQSGIKEVIFMSDKYQSTDSTKASRFMLNKSGLGIREFKSSVPGITLSFNPDSI